LEHLTDFDYLQQQVYSSAYDLDVRSHISNHYLAHEPGWYEWLFAQLALPENGRILELGCGPGDLWQLNEPEVPPSWRVCLSDVSPGMVQAAQQQLVGHALAFSFAVVDTAVLPFAADSFDAVLAFGLLDHLADKQQALSQVRRVLRPGGLFYTSAGGAAHLHQLDELIQPFLPDMNYGGDPDQFGLGNGADWLRPFFMEIEQRLYTNELVFREPEPLAAYILSEPEVRQHLSSAQLHELQSHIEAQMHKVGEIRVTIQKGMFVSK
jgi:ubiquinone/menaquinone biosynthesis C-methylase UbiE